MVEPVSSGSAAARGPTRCVRRARADSVDGVGRRDLGGGEDRRGVRADGPESPAGPDRAHGDRFEGTDRHHDHRDRREAARFDRLAAARRPQHDAPRHDRLRRADHRCRARRTDPHRPGRLSHLHLGLDRQAEGCAADPPRPGESRRRAAGGLRDDSGIERAARGVAELRRVDLRDAVGVRRRRTARRSRRRKPTADPHSNRYCARSE